MSKQSYFVQYIESLNFSVLSKEFTGHLRKYYNLHRLMLNNTLILAEMGRSKLYYGNSRTRSYTVTTNDSRLETGPDYDALCK
jgi:hypothetical protein